MAQGACRLSRRPLSPEELHAGSQRVWFAPAFTPSPACGSAYRITPVTKTGRLDVCHSLTSHSSRLDSLCPTPPLPRFLFILLGALAGLTPLAVDMYLPAIPSIARDLATSIDGAQLTISAFLGGFAIGQLFTARSPTAMAASR